MRPNRVIGTALIATILTIAAVRALRSPAALRVTTAPVTAGRVERQILTTGTLQPVTTVEVGTQISGVVQAVPVDYNSIVHKGQVLARLDSASYQADLARAQATLAQAIADLESARTAQADARTKLTRAQAAIADDLITAAFARRTYPSTRPLSTFARGTDPRASPDVVHECVTRLQRIRHDHYGFVSRSVVSGRHPSVRAKKRQVLGGDTGDGPVPPLLGSMNPFASALGPTKGGRMSPEWLSLILVMAFGTGVLFVFSRYNSLVRARNRTEEAWSGIDVQLRRRASLIPNLIETVRGYAEHERDVFEQVARARGAMQKADGAGQTGAASNLLTQALGRLLAVVENYPQLRASGNFLTLREDLRDTEEKIAFARQFYNRNVLDYNTRIQTYPDAALAQYFGFTPGEFFETDAEGHSEQHVSFNRSAAQPPEPASPSAA